MGRAIAGLAGKGGHTVQSIAIEDTDVAVAGDIVVLAVPYAALADVVATRGASLAGRTVVDVTNPVDMASFDSLVVPADSSAAAELSEQLPELRVLKAFNTNFAATLASGTVGPQTTTVLIAGDDSDAKSSLAEVVTSAGRRAVDAGSLRRARELEVLGFRKIALAAAGGIAWTGGFGLSA